MSDLRARKLIYQKICVVFLCGLASGFIIPVHAGIRGPGKYCGVVVFDRWDTCFLLSGPYITYVSDSVKDELRAYQGKAMQIDALAVLQPMNPGDAVVRKYQIIGPAPNTHHWAMLDGLELVAESDFGTGGTPAFLIEIRNAGNGPVMVDSSEFGPALLGLNAGGLFSASDVKSEAWITRVALVNPSSWEIKNGSVKYSASYEIDQKTRPPQRFQLMPGQSTRVRVIFKVSPGQFQFIVGYGGGVHEEKSLASNAISFDLDEQGIATLATPEPLSPR
jgi:hypothetical protein